MPIAKSGVAPAVFGSRLRTISSKWLLSPVDVKLQVASETRRMNPSAAIGTTGLPPSPTAWVGLVISPASSPLAGSLGRNGANPSSETRCAKLRTPALGTRLPSTSAKSEVPGTLERSLRPAGTPFCVALHSRFTLRTCAIILRSSTDGATFQNRGIGTSMNWQVSSGVSP